MNPAQPLAATKKLKPRINADLHRLLRLISFFKPCQSVKSVSNSETVGVSGLTCLTHYDYEILLLLCFNDSRIRIFRDCQNR